MIAAYTNSPGYSETLMKSAGKSTKGQVKLLRRGLMLALMVLTLGASSFAWASREPGILPPQSHAYGKSYAEWSALWWQWFIQHPMEGHPANPDPNSGFDVRSGQTGRVWFLASAWPHPAIQIPVGTALFIPLVNAECSSLETPESGFHGATEAEQAACAKYWADHIVNPVITIDGKVFPIGAEYRVRSPQFSFVAPTPWVFGDVGGPGTAVGDGYYVLLAPLSAGVHTITITGTLHFAAGELGPDPFDQETNLTWEITVVPGPRQGK